MTDQQELIVWFAILKPWGAVVVLALIYPIKWAVIKYLPEGRLKRLLLFRVGDND